MRIGLITDTHLPSLMRQLDELGPQIGDFLATVDLILHAGDVTSPSVLDWCQQFAPVLVARGNHDTFHDPRLAERHLFQVEGWRLAMVHDLRPESRPMSALFADAGLSREPVDILISGDTHVERLEYREGTVLLNSGSPILPHHKEVRLGTAALLELSPGRLRAEILLLGETPGSRNPGTPQHLELAEGRLRAHSRNGVALPQNGER